MSSLQLMIGNFVNIAQKTTQCLYPTYCLECKKRISDTKISLCKICIEKCRPFLDYCFSCGEKLIIYSDSHYCPYCKSLESLSQSIIIGYEYNDIIRNLILKYKFNKQTHLARTLTELLNPIIQQHDQLINKCTLIVPMPTERLRLATRGFHHILTIAKTLEKKLNIPCTPDVLQKKMLTIPQSILRKKERINNLKNVFYITTQLQDEHILLLDDVITTGTSCKLATKTLYDAGAQSVTALIIAKA